MVEKDNGNFLIKHIIMFFLVLLVFIIDTLLQQMGMVQLHPDINIFLTINNGIQDLLCLERMTEVQWNVGIFTDMVL